jgi:UDP:flavonoid glycosyltransferase YjiC (YdhE family)
MKRIILFGIVGWNIAETTRMIEIAKLAAMDFEVYFASYGGQFNHLVEGSGFKLFNLEPTESPEKIKLMWQIDRGEKYAHPFSIEELRLRVSHELDLFSKINPVAIVMGSVLSFPISARIANIPLVNVIPFALSRGYLNNNLPIVPEYPFWLNKIFIKIAFHLPILTRNFSQVAMSYGLPKFKNIISIWEGDFNLLTEIPLLFKDVHLDDNWKFVGPIYAKLDGDIPQEVIDFISHSNQPTVYFAMGSSANREVLKKVIEILENLPLRIVAPIKFHLEKLDIAIPNNMLVTDWLPAHKVNALCDIAVIHGGQGTVQTACDSGTPFIGIGMQPEQSINIDNIVRFGAAIRIPRRKLSRKRLHESISELLKNPQYKEKAKELMKESSKINGPENVAYFLKNTFNHENESIDIPRTPYTLGFNHKS